MILEKIITLANLNTQIAFLGMERSLRACGCTLPIQVIPYDNNRFELPENSSWWEDTEFTQWMDSGTWHPTLKKYQCLLTSNYQFVDTDVIFLQNPQTVLKEHSNFISTCTHWHNPEQTYTQESLMIFKEETTVWQYRVFNSGQFACDKQLYSLNDLKKTAHEFYKTCLPSNKPFFHEQPGLNLLVFLSKIPVVNLTLAPYFLESSWAGDYNEKNMNKLSGHNKPYLIHWAGQKMQKEDPVSQLFFKYLTQSELDKYSQNMRKNSLKNIWRKIISI